MMVADGIAAVLAEKGITHAFGIIGAGNVALFDAISKARATQIVCCHHEQAAVMAATAWGRYRHAVGVAICTTGAGSANAVTGALAAKMDSAPVVIISGNEPSRYMLSETPVIGVQGFHAKRVAQHVCKAAICTWEYQVTIDPVDALRCAFVTATEGRPGPVWIDICRDQFSARI